MSNFPHLRGEEREVAESYFETMKRLVSNDKVIISSLSEIAYENKNNARVIVQVIEKRLGMIPADHLLPHLYLIDSICKNHGSPFVELFGSNIVNNFIYAFTKSNEKVRIAMYKLRHTWTAAPLFLNRLEELDRKIHAIDPAWPVVRVPQQSSKGPSQKILINPAKFPQPGKKLSEEEETERMRKELLQKEKELIELKRRTIESQLEGLKKEHEAKSNPVVSSSGSTADEAKISSTKKVSETSKERDPRRRRKPDTGSTSTQSTISTSSGKSESSRSSSNKPADGSSKLTENGSRSSESSSRSSEGKAKSDSRHKDKKSSRSDKTDRNDKSNSSNSKSSSKSSSGSSRSSSRSSSSKDKGKDTAKDKEKEKSKKPSPKKEESLKKDQPQTQVEEVKKESAKKREREPSPKFSRSPSPMEDGRISPLPPPPIKRIPKLRKSSDEDVRPDKRAEKRQKEEDREQQPPEKRPKPLMIDVNTPESGPAEQNSPAVGWAKHKETNPDRFHTPVKDFDFPFPPRGPPPPWLMDNRGRGRGFRSGRGFGMDRGGNRGFRNDHPRFRGPAPFGRGGGGRFPGPPRFPLPLGLPELPEADMKDPEKIRNEVVPNLMLLAQTCLEVGNISEDQFKEFTGQVMSLKETSESRELEKKQQNNQENKENRFRRDKFGSSGPRSRPEEANGDWPDVVEVPPQVPKIPQHKNDLPMADASVLEEIRKDPTKELRIDDMPRPIRYYGETATIVMDDNRICELSFKEEPEPRQIIMDNSLRIYCRVGAEHFTEFNLNGRKHRIKIGKPTRELYIDDRYYECFFDNRVRVFLDGKHHVFYLPGPLPRCDIGLPRPDLCRGRVYARIDSDSENLVSLYLDHKPQLVLIAGKPHVFKFVEDFKTVTINGHPFRADLGNFPMVISVQGTKHYVQLSEMPRPAPGDQPKVNQSAPFGDQGRRISPTPGARPVTDRRSSPTPGAVPATVRRTSPPRPHPGTPPREQGVGFPPPIDTEPIQSPKDARLQGSRESPPPVTSTPVVPPLENLPTPTVTEVPPPPTANQPDINDLWAKLQSAGLFSMFGGGSSAAAPPGLGGQPTVDAGGIPGLGKPADTIQPMEVDEVKQDNSAEIQRKKARRNSFGLKEIVLKSHDPSLRERQQCIVDSLYGPSDLQCKSCGHRFSREEMTNYSSHLDWHFRAKRRERDNARKAQSRKWYYEKNDWIVSDEIEDEEQDMTEEEMILEQSVEVPTVTVKGKAEDEQESCPVCLELFNQVFKQGEEENEEATWYLHNAMRDTDDVAYHPECFKDKEAQEKRGVVMDTDVQNLSLKDEDDIQEIPVEPKPEPELVTIEENEENGAEEGEEAEVVEDVASLDVEMIKMDAENIEVPKIKVEPGIVDEAEEDKKEEVEEEEKEEDTANKTLNLEGTENGIPTPVAVPKPKVDIKVSLTSAVGEVDRQESVISVEEEEDSEFDKEAIIVPAVSSEQKDLDKPRLKGRNLSVIPPCMKDKDISSLCTIM